MIKNIEQAVVLSVPETRTPDLDAISGFDCIYAGDEFCQVKLPSAADLKRLRASFKGRITLASPVLTDKWMGKFKKLTTLMNTWKNAEVVVNDIGALGYLRGLKRFRPRISLGRVLAHDFNFFIASSRFKELFGRLLTSVEIDAEHELGICSRVKFLKINLHYPLKFVGFSRNCYVTRHINNKCALECLGKNVMEIYPGPIKEKLFSSGNALFCGNRSDYALNGGIQGLLNSGLNVGRIVYNSGLKEACLLRNKFLKTQKAAGGKSARPKH